MTIGFTAVLHTWTQLLLYHPHIHCIVPGGGPDPKDSRWVPARRDFFLPVRVFSEVFRGKLLGLLEKALDREKIRGGPDEDPRRLLKRAARKKWAVYSKPPFAGAAQVRITSSASTARSNPADSRWRDRAQYCHCGRATRESTNCRPSCTCPGHRTRDGYPDWHHPGAAQPPGRA